MGEKKLLDARVKNTNTELNVLRFQTANINFSRRVYLVVRFNVDTSNVHTLKWPYLWSVQRERVLSLRGTGRRFPGEWELRECGN